jgi:hypothetical protein
MRDKQVSCEDVSSALRGESRSQWTAEAMDHLAQCERCLETAVESALQRAPEIQVPAEFARQTAGMAAASIANIARARIVPSYGRSVAVTLLLTLSIGVGALVAMYPLPTTNGPLLMAECIGILELGGLALWVGRPCFE